MAEACTIDFKGVKYIFQNKQDEVPHLFVKRCWILVKNKDVFDDPRTLEMVSHAWINIHYMNVTYDSKINALLDRLV